MKKPSFKLPILDESAFIELSETFKKYDLEYPAVPFYKALENFGDCELLHRKSERAKKLKMPKAKYYENFAMVHNSQGLRRLKNAKLTINKIIKKFPPDLEKKISKTEMNRILNEHESIFKDEIFESDFKPEEAEIIWTNFVKTRKVLDDRGTEGLLKYIISNIDELVKSRTDLKKGRKEVSFSPYVIPWWKIAAIAVYSGVRIYTLWWCFATSDCSWALATLSSEVLALILIIKHLC